MIDQLNQDIKEAMKNKDKDKLQALRYLKSMLTENSTAKKPASELDVVVRHHKKIKEAIDSYPDGHPMKIAAEKEVLVIEHYLPKQLSEDEVVSIIESIKSSLDNPNMGAIMKELTPQIKGQFDGKKASELVKKSL